MFNLNIKSETGKLKLVLLHEPGKEVENMTPDTAERALYSDILNLSVASKEYGYFKEVLKKIANVFEVKEMLLRVTSNNKARMQIIEEISQYKGNDNLAKQLQFLSNEELTRQILEGVPLAENSLTNFLSRDRYILSPLHNIFFTRDATFVIGNSLFIGSMAKRIRVPEAIIIKSLFEFEGDFNGDIIPLDLSQRVKGDNATIEGGDIIVVSEDTLIIGIGSRTNSHGVDLLVEELTVRTNIKYILIQELPDKPESFIHLDMVFTLLSENECMLYEPLILGSTKYHTVLMKIKGNKVTKIEYVRNLLDGLKIAGHEFSVLRCGGSERIWQDREQWQSGANFLSFAPGKVIGYDRNIRTADELNKNGYEVVSAKEFLSDSRIADEHKKLLITIPGSELSRGGGGPRCMSMPLLRD
ncbi:MAG: arginine deiminase [Bacteroidales bacterium]|nr:arginine deiminase [Bacteroidales bacterium]